MLKWFFSSMVLAAITVMGCAPDLPKITPPDDVVWLDQNWSDQERHWFHHASQGTSTLPIPYDWFMALEQPGLWSSGDASMLSDQAYLARFGFIPSPAKVEAGKEGYKQSQRTFGRPATYDATEDLGNPDALPVGFAKTPAYTDPATGRQLPDQIGFTCAACHTGQIDYQGVSLRIDGAPAMIDLGKFRATIGSALTFTNYLPGRFDSFARRVLGDAYNAETKADLSNQLKTLIKRGKQRRAMLEPFEKLSVDEGYGRLDALNRIGNQVFFTDLLGSEIDAIGNYAPTNAPVSFPPIWDTPWFNWVQYDASIMQPVVRNVGEALGVSARVNLSNPTRPLYVSSVKVAEIDAMEEMLAGQDPFDGETGFKGLRAPVWPEAILGKIDPIKRERGRVLYQRHCEGCHLPPVDDPDGRFWSGDHWYTPAGAYGRYLRVKPIKLGKIGTDPGQAKVLSERSVSLPDFLEVDPTTLCLEGGAGEAPVLEAKFGQALAVVVEKTATAWYDANDVSTEDRQRMNGDRPNCLREPPAGYKARPLDGIWATAPFLHNGSVPNLRALLSPTDEGERPATFCVGSRKFDPTKVGYDTTCEGGLFEVDTAIPGNLNTGHEFAEGAKEKSGVIGPRLSPEDRWALIEFLKSTPSS
ncbi:MAG: di-heme-cytochrome C peroxidase [Geminicoccaceae bacterium]